MVDLSQLQNISRADFISSVGLYVSGDRLIMVRLRKNFLDLSMVEQEERELAQGDQRHAISELTGWVAEDVREIALKAESDSHERALRQAIISLLPHFNAARDAVYICVPHEQAIVQEVFLPLAAQDNLQQVLDYEIERQLPFKRDEIYYDYLPIGKRGEKFGLYVFAIPKTKIDSLLTLLESFGIKPRGVETTATALANYLLFSYGGSANGAGLIVGHANDLEMVGVHAKGNGWTAAPELLFCHRFPASHWAQGASQELLRECLGQVPRFFRGGNLGPVSVGANGRLADAEDIVAMGNPRINGFKQSVDVDTLPAIGTALRGVREASLRTNFLHHEDADKGGVRRFSMLNRVLVGLFVFGLIAWGMSYPVKDELRLRQLQKENQKLDPAVQALRREEGQLDQLRKEIGLLTELSQRRGEVLRVLDELSKVVPTSAYFSNLRFRTGLLEIQGNAENASALIPLLEKSPYLENVAFNAPSNRGRDNRETFSLKAEMEKLKAESQAPASIAPKPSKIPNTKETKANP